MEYTYLEKKVMVCTLMVIAIQDGEIDENEIKVLKDSLDIDNDLLVASSKIALKDALDTINLMPMMKKVNFSMIALKVAQVHECMHPAATSMTKQFFDYLGITKFLDATKKYNERIKDADKRDWSK